MKYGQYLLDNRLPGWEAHYMDYNKLKLMIKHGAPDQEFMDTVRSELQRLDLFVGGKVSEIVSNLRFLMSSSGLEASEELQRAEQIATDIVNLDVFTEHNATGFRKIIKKYRKYVAAPVAWFHTMVDSSRLSKATDITHGLIVQLSEFYQRGLQSEAVWQPPSSFSRKTTKYWVTPDFVAQLKCNIIKHLPILEVNSSESIQPNFFEQDLDQLHNFISSVYLDNDRFECYHRRIQLLEGAQLLRIRWYGGHSTSQQERGLFPEPAPKQTLYVERKTHHTAESGLKSVKERFPIDLDLLPAFLHGELPAAKVFEIMTLQGRMTQSDVDKYLELAQECQDLVVNLSLKPKLRTVYHRTAFQLSSSNTVRISLDYPCFFVPQDGDDPLFWSKLPAPSHADAFEYGILEVKLAGDETPAWVQGIIDHPAVTALGKFSKFQTTVATHYPDKLHIAPFWMDALSQTRAGDAYDSDTEKTPALQRRASATPAADADVASQPVAPAGPVAETSFKQGAQDVAIEMPPAKAPPRLTSSVPAVIPSTTTSKDKDKNPRTKGKAALPKRTNLVRTKVEPKTYFANERTLIQWFSAAILLVTLSTATLGLNKVTRLVGTIFVPISLLFILYAVGVYRWRLKKIRERRGTRFDDPIGPWLMAVVLVLGVVSSLVVVWIQEDVTSVNGVTYMRSQASQQSVSNINYKSIVSPLPFAAARIQGRGCKATPSVDAWPIPPRYFDLQESIDPFPTISKEQEFVWRMEDRAQLFAPSSRAEMLTSTIDVYCIDNTDDCSERFLTYNREAKVLTYTMTVVESGTVLPSHGSNSTSCSSGACERLTATADCDNSHLEYYLRIENVVSPVTTTDALNSLLATSFFAAGTAIRLEYTHFKAVYLYEFAANNMGMNSLALTLVFLNAQDQSLHQNPVETSVNLVVSAPVTSAQLRQVEGVLQFASEVFQANYKTPLIAVVCCLLMLAFVLLSIAYYFRKTPQPHEVYDDAQKADSPFKCLTSCFSKKSNDDDEEDASDSEEGGTKQQNGTQQPQTYQKGFYEPVVEEKKAGVLVLEPVPDEQQQTVTDNSPHVLDEKLVHVGTNVKRGGSVRLCDV
eukprot:m.163444 g.163444  ORF g.163444 m.163444 type:complete len:1093 (-) comp14385_c1_seq1:422-3700(-)